jgi:hypothetical protein
VDHIIGLDDSEKRQFLTLLGLELDPPVVQPIASRYTDYAIPAPTLLYVFMYIFSCIVNRLLTLAVLVCR